VVTSRGRSRSLALGFERDAILARLGGDFWEMYLRCDSGDVEEGRAGGTRDSWGWMWKKSLQFQAEGEISKQSPIFLSLSPTSFEDL
jgi:hypothetical protein